MPSLTVLAVLRTALVIILSLGFAACNSNKDRGGSTASSTAKVAESSAKAKSSHTAAGLASSADEGAPSLEPKVFRSEAGNFRVAGPGEPSTEDTDLGDGVTLHGFTFLRPPGALSISYADHEEPVDIEGMRNGRQVQGLTDPKVEDITVRGQKALSISGKKGERFFREWTFVTGKRHYMLVATDVPDAEVKAFFESFDFLKPPAPEPANATDAPTGG